VPTRVGAIAISVNGPKDNDESVREFTGKVDFEKLKSLLP
jgi:hypothetical protein